MITHIPMFAHADPKRVLIVGGGDGGVLREVTRHQTVLVEGCLLISFPHSMICQVEQIDMCEIDAQVVEVAKEYFGGCTAVAYDDARLNLLHMDAAKYLADNPELKYDVIIVDSSDPVNSHHEEGISLLYTHPIAGWASCFPLRVGIL